VLAPHQTCRATEGGKINQLDSGTVLDHRRRLAPLTVRPPPAGLDMDPDRFVSCVVDAEDIHVAESDKQFTHGSRVGFHRGSPF